MLLTGFDAPVEQVLYLDRPMKGAELLQAIARVNRPAPMARTCGYVIDYVGVTTHLTAALKEYAAEDIQGSLADLETRRSRHLDDLRRRVVMLSSPARHHPPRDTLEECVLLLSDGELRDRFEAELAPFLATVDTVLPMPEALPYLAVRLFTEIATRVRRRYRDGGDFDPSLYGAKVRELIDEHMAALGVTAMLPPVSITDPEYADKVARLGGPAPARRRWSTRSATTSASTSARTPPGTGGCRSG